MKFKKMKAILTASALAATVFVSAGCGRTTKADEERNLEKKLEEKYGEEFTVIKSYISDPYWWDDAPGTLEATCCLKDDESMVFEATYGLAGKTVWDDSYIQTVLEKKMTADLEQFLSDRCDNYFVRAWVKKPNMQTYEESKKYTAFTKASDVTVNSYEEMYGEKMEVTFYVVLDWARASRSYSYADEILGLYSKRFKDANISFHCFLQSIEMIEAAKNISERENYTGEDVLIYLKGCRITDYLFKHEKDKGFYLFKVYEYHTGEEVIKDGSEFYESEE